MSRGDKQPEQEAEHLQHAAEHERPGKNRVMTYLVILFAAAFCLMLLSYLMQQRNNREAMEGLKQSVSTMTSVQDLLTQNQTLEGQVKDLEGQVQDLTAQVKELQELNTTLDSARQEQNNNLDQLTDQLTAMDSFWQLDRAYLLGRYTQCRELIQAMEEAELDGLLPQESEAGDLSPAQRYQDIHDALF